MSRMDVISDVAIVPPTPKVESIAPLSVSLVRELPPKRIFLFGSRTAADAGPSDQDEKVAIPYSPNAVSKLPFGCNRATLAKVGRPYESTAVPLTSKSPSGDCF